eukprot:jgi/Mesvir1/10186/Mv05728-RA.1
MVDMMAEESDDVEAGSDNEEEGEEVSNLIASDEEIEDELPSFYAAVDAAGRRAGGDASSVGGSAAERSGGTALGGSAGLGRGGGSALGGSAGLGRGGGSVGGGSADGGGLGFDASEFRTLLSEEGEVAAFVEEVNTFGEEKLNELASITQVAIIDHALGYIMADVFGLCPADVPDHASAAELQTACWNNVMETTALNEIVEKMEPRCARTISRLMAIWARMVDVQAGMDVQDIILHAIAVVYSARESVSSMIESRRRRDDNSKLAHTIVRLSSGEWRLNEYQVLLRVLSQRWERAGVRRGPNGEDGVYERVITPDGYDTHHWVKSTTMAEWVSDQVAESDPTLWRLANRDGG